MSRNVDFFFLEVEDRGPQRFGPSVAAEIISQSTEDIQINMKNLTDRITSILNEKPQKIDQSINPFIEEIMTNNHTNL